MSLSKLSKLSPEVLSSVLNNKAIPLRRRLRLRLLSNRWADIIEDGLKKETSLGIRDDDAQYPIRKPDDLVINNRRLTEENIRTLCRLFSGTTQLTLAFGGWGESSASWRTVPSLLAHLSTNLTSVKQYGGIEATMAEPLAAALTAISGLTSLTLFGRDLNRILLPHLAPVLSRLEKCACPLAWMDSASFLSSSLSPQCTHLMLHSRVFCTFSGPFNAQLSASLTNLHLMCCGNIIWQSLLQMHRLVSLALYFYHYELKATLFSRLALISCLTNVKLFGLVYRSPLALPLKKAPLSSIKHLTLEVNFGETAVDYQVFFRGLSAWFPSLARLTLITLPSTFPAIQASLGQLSFSVKLVDCQTVDRWSPDW